MTGLFVAMMLMFSLPSHSLIRLMRCRLFMSKHFSTSTEVLTHENVIITIRQATQNDAIGMSNCNKANLPEYYSDTLCNQFIAKWPSLCIVAVAKSTDSRYNDENVIGYALGRVEIPNWSANKLLSSVAASLQKSPLLNTGYTGHVSSIAVHPAFRGLGIAHAFMNRLHESFANDYNIDIVTLHVRANNLAAINLYTSAFPYQFSQRLTRYYDDGEDAWFMTLNGNKKLIKTRLSQKNDVTNVSN